MMKRILTVVLIVLLVCACAALSGCTKDGFLGCVNQVMQNIGDNCLTKSYMLEGERSFGEDSYTGSYQADYRDYTGRETLFGNTALERSAGTEIEVTCTLEIEEGSVKLYYKSGADGTVTLLDETGRFHKTIDLPIGSNYIGVVCRDFTGRIDLGIE